MKKSDCSCEVEELNEQERKRLREEVLGGNR